MEINFSVLKMLQYPITHTTVHALDSLDAQVCILNLSAEGIKKKG